MKRQGERGMRPRGATQPPPSPRPGGPAARTAAVGQPTGAPTLGGHILLRLIPTEQGCVWGGEQGRVSEPGHFYPQRDFSHGQSSLCPPPIQWADQDFLRAVLQFEFPPTQPSFLPSLPSQGSDLYPDLKGLPASSCSLPFTLASRIRSP